MKLTCMLRTTCGAAIAIALASTAHAQDEATAVDTTSANSIETANQIVVQAQIGVRTRSDEAEPTLIYDESYFQRFEPLTAGDALKRVR